MKRWVLIIFLFQCIHSAFAKEVKTPLMSLTHIQGLQTNPLIGYGLVMGLSGSGDSSRSVLMNRSIANMLQNLGINIDPQAINSRNTAAVIITATLPPFAREGDKMDINVSSLGDARSLVGGTLLLAPLKGPDQQTYALAQGSVSVGGFKYDMFGNVIQKNHPTVGIVPGGATLTKTLSNRVIQKGSHLQIVIDSPNYTIASRIEAAINNTFHHEIATAQDANTVSVHLAENDKKHLVNFIDCLQNIGIVTETLPTVVVNERTGIIVSGGDVRIDNVTISHGNLEVTINTQYNVSQPIFIRQTAPSVRTAVVPETHMSADEERSSSVSLPKGATVAELISALSQVKTSTRDMIGILESLKRAGALHAELIIQ